MALILQLVEQLKEWHGQCSPKKKFWEHNILNAGLSPYVLRNSCCNDACNSTSGKLLTSLSQKHSYNINTNFCICCNLFVGRRIFPTQNYGSNTASKQYLQIPFFFQALIHPNIPWISWIKYFLNHVFLHLI